MDTSSNQGICWLKKARFSKLRSCPALTPNPKFFAFVAASTKGAIAASLLRLYAEA